MTKRILWTLLAAASLLSLSGCLAAAAGAAVGYGAHKQGYRVQSPITKEE